MTALLEARGLRYKYPSGLDAVVDVDLDVPAGARHAVIGCNGAGKTTLLNLLSGNIRPTSGTIRHDGRAITRASPASRCRRGIARTFQTPAILPSLTVRENVELGARPHHRFRRGELATLATTVMDDLGLLELADTAGARLSHGQRRLVEIAAVLASRPQVLLLDEPAAGLTDTDVERVADCLSRLPDELAMVIVEHHQELVAALARLVTVLHNGSVLTSGTPAEVSADATVLDVYLGAR